MMGEAHGLGGLHVGAAGQEHVLMLFGALHEHAHEGAGKADPFAELIGSEEAEVQADLVVAAAAGVELLAHVAHELSEAGLDVHVHVFEILTPREHAVFDLLFHLVETGAKGFGLFTGDDALFAQHAGMGFGTGDILSIQDAVEGNGFRIGFNGKAGAFFEAAAPGLFGHGRLREGLRMRDSSGSGRKNATREQAAARSLIIMRQAYFWKRSTRSP